MLDADHFKQGFRLREQSVRCHVGRRLVSFLTQGTGRHIARCPAFLPTATTECQWLPHTLLRRIPALVGTLLPPGEQSGLVDPTMPPPRSWPNAVHSPSHQGGISAFGGSSHICHSPREPTILGELCSFVHLPPGSPEPSPFAIELQVSLSAWHTVGTQ